MQNSYYYFYIIIFISIYFINFRINIRILFQKHNFHQIDN